MSTALGSSLAAKVMVILLRIVASVEVLLIACRPLQQLLIRCLGSSMRICTRATSYAWCCLLHFHRASSATHYDLVAGTSMLPMESSTIVLLRHTRDILRHAHDQALRIVAE
jgi:hypothetical protein